MLGCITGGIIKSSPRIFQTHLMRFNQPFPNTAVITITFGPFMSMETKKVVILIMKYNYILGYFHADGAFDDI